MKIGLVTLHDFNYGSALQCFATQTYIESYYCECELIQKQRCSNRLIGIANTLFSYSLLCLKHPRDIRNIIQQIKAQRSKSLVLSEASLKEINRFNQLFINKREVDSKTLHSSNFLDEYDYFFSGSDQVWNGSRVNTYDMFFLRFAPLEKRIAWAPSFGSGKVASYNVRSYRKYISEYSKLSVREESGVEIIRDLTGKETNLLCDPVVLLTVDEWRKQYAKNTTVSFPSDCITLFFIDEISDTALDNVIKFQKETGLPVYSFGYDYSKYTRISNHMHLDGNPFDFLKVIDQSRIVMTDSFHATVFSMLFHSEFYTYTRKYTHKQNQSTRIESLLNRVDSIDRFNSPKLLSRLCVDKFDEYFSKERVNSDKYLSSILGEKKKRVLFSDRPVLYSKYHECTGCGACVNVCPKGCIYFEMMEDKALYPVINELDCIKCKKCESVCHLKKYEIKTNSIEIAKVGYCCNEELYSNSASGGVFAAIAHEFLVDNGIVYGASLSSDENGMPVCEHIRIDAPEKLYKILNSKYVQSSTVGIFPILKNDLENGRKVLFSGTSCQIASLYTYFGKEYKDLYTIDLVCHGVPGMGLLDDYVTYIKTSDRNLNLSSFRIKRNPPYVLNFSGDKKIKMRDSAYYRMFMAQAGYRRSCYACKYANRNKPADITLGDFYEKENLKNLKVNSEKELYSSILIRTPNGEKLIDNAKEILDIDDFSFDILIESHSNLQSASLITPMGRKLLNIYKNKGFSSVQKYIDRRNNLVNILSIIKKK